MKKNDRMPSETEWLVMETIWNSGGSLTSAEIIERLKQVGGRPGFAEEADTSLQDVSRELAPKTVRVLVSRLCQKGLLDYTIDAQGSRVYHYFATKTREECLREKSRHFVDSYFSGSGSGAVAALIQNMELSDKERQELQEILEKGAGMGYELG